MQSAKKGIEHKTCPLCGGDGPFGVCRARKDGLNLYCMSCIRNKVNESRRALREYRRAKRNRQQLPQRSLQQGLPLIQVVPSRPDGMLHRDELRDPAHPHVMRVLSAIYYGARTAEEITKAVGRWISTETASKGGWGDDWSQLDQVGESIAELLFADTPLIQRVSGRQFVIARPKVEVPMSEVAGGPGNSLANLSGTLHPVLKGRAA